MGSRGPDPSCDEEDYLDAVRGLCDPENDLGAPAAAVASRVGVSRQWAAEQLNDLVEQGALERERYWGRNGRPPWYYKPTVDTDPDSNHE